MSDIFDTDGQDEGNSNEYQEANNMGTFNDHGQNIGNSELVDASLLKQVTELINGARIEKISNNQELEASVTLLQQVKRTRKDFEAVQDAKVKPLYETYKETLAYFKSRVDALKQLEDNIGNKGAEYQKSERLRIEREAREAEQARLEQVRLLELEKQKLFEQEELLRKEAEAKFDSNDNQAGNLANETADIAIQEVNAIEEKIIEVVSTPIVQQKVYTPSSFKGKTEYFAIVENHWEALKMLVVTDQRGYLDSEGLRKAVESACNKMAKNMQGNFKLVGCRLGEKEVGGRGVR